MEKNISVKLLLKYSLDSSEIFEESVIIVKLNSIDEIKVIKTKKQKKRDEYEKLDTSLDD